MKIASSYAQDNAIQLNVGEIDRVITVNCFADLERTLYTAYYYLKREFN
jgi:hypothetical protein